MRPSEMHEEGCLMGLSLLIMSPGNRSTRNVGDYLLADSIRWLVEGTNGSIDVTTKLMIDEPDEELKAARYDAVVIVSPRIEGPIVPRIEALMGAVTAGSHRPPFYVIGANQSIRPSSKYLSSNPRLAAERLHVPPDNVRLFHRIVDAGGFITCRDVLAQLALKKNGVESDVIGDPALYRLQTHGLPLKRPGDRVNFVVTLPHQAAYKSQSTELIENLASRYGNAAVAVSLHAMPTKQYEEDILELAREKGIAVIDAYNDGTTFPAYEDFDIHIGHRLHGHISFLRERKPSILLCEDGRSVGHAITLGALAVDSMRYLSDFLPQKLAKRILPMGIWPDAMAPTNAIALLEEEFGSNFSRSEGVLRAVDCMYTSKMKPIIERLARRSPSNA